MTEVPSFLRIWRLLSGADGPMHYKEVAAELGMKPTAAYNRLVDLSSGKYPGYSVRALARGTFQRSSDGP